MDRFTLMPWLVALIAGVANLTPTNVYKVCAWGAGTLQLEPWRRRASTLGDLQLASVGTWLRHAWAWRLAFACVIVLIALLIAQQPTGHEGVLIAAGLPTGAALKSKRTKLVREANALRNADGTFENDDKRQAFDAKMAEVEALDARSETLVERSPADDTPPADEEEPETEPNLRDVGADAERDRITGILTATRASRLPQSFADKLIADKVPLVDAQTRVFKELQKRDGAAGPKPGSGPAVEMGDDPLVHVRGGIEDALLHRVRPKTPSDEKGFELTERGRRYRGMSLLRIAEVYIQQLGVRTTELGKMKIAGMALGLETRAPGMHTTSDFSNLLADVANKTLRAAYLEAPQTWQPLARRTTLPDFKPVKRLQLGEAPALLEVGEHGEFTFGTIGEGKEQYQLATFGRRFAITRKALVNDDTDAFARVPTLFGRSARNLESDTVWSQITANANMGDGIALFHASHGNLASVAAAIAVGPVGIGRAAMRNQKGVDGATLLNIGSRYLIVPAALETTADQFVSTQLYAATQATVNPFAGRLSVIAEPRLDVNSATAWYMSSTPEQIDIIEYAYLEGEEGPMIESRVGFEVDGLEIKCREDFAAKVIDYRGLFKNAGV